MFKKKVKNCVDQANRKLYDNPPINSDDPHAIKFANIFRNNL